MKTRGGAKKAGVAFKANASLEDIAKAAALGNEENILTQRPPTSQEEQSDEDASPKVHSTDSEEEEDASPKPTIQ